MSASPDKPANERHADDTRVSHFRHEPLRTSVLFNMTKAMDKKKVSVVMCTYNGEKYLREQIDSILAQTYAISELVAQDDCSTDSTPAILQEYARADRRIKVHVNPRRLGFNRNFSSALLKATGDFVACSDQDDIWRKDKIERLLEHIGDAALVFHNSVTFTGDVRHTGKRRLPVSFRYDDASVLLKTIGVGHELLFRREILSLYRKAYEREPDISYDQLLMITAMAAGQTRYVDEDLVFWRRHPKTAGNLVRGLVYPDARAGFLAALKAMRDPQKREVIRRFFRAISSYDFRNPKTNDIVRHMALGTWYGVLKTCMICGLHERRVFFPPPLIPCGLSSSRSSLPSIAYAIVHGISFLVRLHKGCSIHPVVRRQTGKTGTACRHLQTYILIYIKQLTRPA